MAWTQAQIDQLRETIMALATGAMESITFADQTYKFVDLDKLRELLKDMETEVSVTEGKASRYAATSKGV